MDHLLNKAPEDPSANDLIKHEFIQPLPHLAAQLAASARSPSSSAAGLGLQMLSAAPPRLPPISLLTAAAATLQPMDPQLRPNITPLQTGVSPTSSSSSCASRTPLAANEMLCRYRNKKCGYPRGIKRNGERHNLCEHHRVKANQNQRKLESKRRTKKRLMQRVHLAGKAKKVTTETDVTDRVLL